MTVLRAPEDRFTDLPNFEYDPRYVTVGDTRLAYVEAGEGDADGVRRGEETFLCLHGEPTWSFLYRKMLPVLAKRGRALAPDLPGFGRSDRWPDPDDYSYARLYDAVEGFVEALDLTDVTLVCQDWGGLLGLAVAAEHPDRFARLVPMNTGLPDGTQEMPEVWHRFRDIVETAETLRPERLVRAGCLSEPDEAVLAAYAAPFPDESHRAGARALPGLVPTDPADPAAASLREARERLGIWEKPAFVLFGDSDPITRDARADLRNLLPTAGEQPDVWIEGAGHFLQEDAGRRVAEAIVEFVDRTGRSGGS